MGKTKTAFIGEALEGEKPKKVRKEEPKKVHISGLKGGQRIKVMEVEPVEAETGEIKEEGKEEKKKVKAPKVRGKKYQEAKAKVNPTQTYPLAEAIKLAKETSYSSFDGTMELHLIVKKTGLSVSLTLPHAAGKEKRIEIATDATIKKLESGKIDFDTLVATPEMMPKLLPFARILGPKGLMPNPKNGTLVKDSKKAEGFSGNKILLKTEKEAPLIHTTLGKVSQPDKEIIENAQTIFSAVNPKQILKAYTKASMGPSVKIAIS